MAKTPRAVSVSPAGSLDEFAARLLTWYDRVRRPLPWRRDTHPYTVWLSEAMLQQTRVETAIPYYRRFVRALPTVGALARASEEDVRALWSGLGYYRRARMLHRAAREIVEAGEFPKTSRGWRRLPGVGPYTAAAVASICFGERVVALDGNLERVLARLEAYGENPKNATGRRFLVSAGEKWLDASRPGDSNQALMELGATICLPSNPRCGECPVAGACRARRLKNVEDFPRKAIAGIKKRQELVTVRVRRGERLLLFRRGLDAALLAGTWETPWVQVAPGGDQPETALARRYGGSWTLTKRIATVRHTITNRDLSVNVYEGILEGSALVEEGGNARWADRLELDELPHSSLLRKVFETAGRG